MPLDQLQLQLGNRLGRIEAFWAGLGTVHDGVAAIEPERVLEIVEPLAGRLIARILDPARRLQQRGGPQKALAVPPIARAGGRTAGAQNALVEPVELFAILVALPPFLLRCRRGGLQPRLDRGVLRVEICPVWPSMFMAEEPPPPSRQGRRKVSVGSMWFLIQIRPSSTIGPQSLVSMV